MSHDEALDFTHIKPRPKRSGSDLKYNKLFNALKKDIIADEIEKKNRKIKQSLKEIIEKNNSEHKKA